MKRAAETTPKKQASLSSLWGLASPAPEEPPSSHKKLRSLLSPDGAASFYKDLEAKRLEAETLEAERVAAAARRRAQASAQGGVLDPEDRGRGVPRGPRRGGRPEGSKVGYKGTHKPRAAPTLRRDPPAQCKLQVVVIDWAKHATARGVEKSPPAPRAR